MTSRTAEIAAWRCTWERAWGSLDSENRCMTTSFATRICPSTRSRSRGGSAPVRSSARIKRSSTASRSSVGLKIVPKRLVERVAQLVVNLNCNRSNYLVPAEHQRCEVPESSRDCGVTERHKVANVHSPIISLASVGGTGPPTAGAGPRLTGREERLATHRRAGPRAQVQRLTMRVEGAGLVSPPIAAGTYGDPASSFRSAASASA